MNVTRMLALLATMAGAAACGGSDRNAQSPSDSEGTYAPEGAGVTTTTGTETMGAPHHQTSPGHAAPSGGEQGSPTMTPGQGTMGGTTAPSTGTTGTSGSGSTMGGTGSDPTMG